MENGEWRMNSFEPLDQPLALPDNLTNYQLSIIN
jgi:hypothetical protein